MAERGVSGAPISQEQGGDQAIARLPTGITAFVGRTMKGPLNAPVAVASFAEFQQVFGGLWQPAMLGYAVEQYFENGGRRALIVRVANGARPPSIALPAGASALILAGLNPGSRENLRAAVDYDGIGALDGDRFNLVVQRVRVPGSELIEEQEIFRRLSIEEGAARYVGDVLAGSRLVRMLAAAPRVRPDRTGSRPGGPLVGYVASGADGDDGAALTDYDVIGSAVRSTGLFALQGVGRFDLLCIPPLGRDRDVGLSTLLVAARFCRERRALLVVDPPREWSTAQVAVERLRLWPFRSENALMFFPRIVAVDRLRNRPETFGSAAAGAGLIARGDESLPVWMPAEAEDAILRPALKISANVEEAERVKLARAGVNTLLSARSGSRTRLSPRTLAAESSGASDWKYLAARRLALFVVASIESGTRWLATASSKPEIWNRAREQVERFLAELAENGAFAGSRPEDSYFVVCDERVNRPDAVAAGEVNLLYGFATTRPAEFHAWLNTYQAGQCRARSVAVNRSATSQDRVDWEIETSILRS